MSLAGPFLFDPRAFWGDENVRLMTGEQVAAYLKLLSLQWEGGDLPSDPVRLAALMSEGVRSYTPGDLVGQADSFSDAVRDGSDTRFEGTLEAPLEGSLWEGLKPCFKVVEGRLFNERLADEREVWVDKKARMSAGGKKGGKRSSRAKKRNSKPPLGQAQARLKPPSSSTSSSSSSVSEKTPSSSSRKREMQKEVEERIAVAHFEEKKVCKRLLGENPPRSTTLPKAARDAIKRAMLDGYTEENLLEAIGHVRNDAYLMGKLNGHTGNPQLSLDVVLLIRPQTKTKPPYDRVAKLIDKTVPDREMRDLVGRYERESKRGLFE